MKKIISLVCAVVLLALCIAPMPAKAATTTDTLEMSAVFLRTAEGKEGIFFGARFNLSQNTLDDMSCYGLALTTKALDDDTWTAEMDKGVLRSSYTSGLKAGATKEVTSTSLVNIINISNDFMTNNRNVNTVIYVRPYVEKKGGSFVYGDTASITMMQILKWVDEAYNDEEQVNNTQKQGLLGMYERFSSCMKGWGLTNLKKHYNNGGYVTVKDENNQEKQVSLILQYRREKVVANMTAQNNVLWSFDGENTVQYSRRPTSNGLTQDIENYPDDVYTLYPKRVYRGIPYTHGSAGLASFEHLGTKDQYGVVNFSDFHGSYFNGGSTAGNNTNNGMYNVARLGSDCWDAVYWAWASAGAHTTADQTQQMTPDYGLNIVGQEILEDAMKGQTYDDIVRDGKYTEKRPEGVSYNTVTLTGDLIADICTTNSAGKIVYKSITNKSTKVTENGVPVNYTTGYIDGTKIVTYGTRRINEDGTHDYPAMYKTYAMAKPGDAMVHYSNTNGHAIMVIDTNIVFKNKVLNADGTVNLAESTIDGDASNIILLEQASGHEKRQSHPGDYFTYDLDAHSTHADQTKYPECAYCAGYTDETTEDGREIWKLDYGLQVRTFKTMAESDYLAVTHDVLTDPAAKISASRISDSASDADVSGIYTGTLNSTYRVAHIILDIFDDAGNKVNSSTCFGIQSGNTTPFDISRFVTDATIGKFGSVLKGKPALQQKTSGTNTWLEAPTLEAGSYSYTMTCVLSNGYTKTFRTGYFHVAEGKNFLGETVNMVNAD